MPRTLRFHQQLVGNRLLRLDQIPADQEYDESIDLVFEHNVRLIAQVDDEGNPGPCWWNITNPQGRDLVELSLSALCGRAVVSVGYFASNPGGWPAVTPYIELEGGAHICCETPRGGGVIYHHRSECADTLCQFDFTQPI